MLEAEVDAVFAEIVEFVKIVELDIESGVEAEVKRVGLVGVVRIVGLCPLLLLCTSDSEVVGDTAPEGGVTLDWPLGLTDKGPPITSGDNPLDDEADEEENELEEEL